MLNYSNRYSTDKLMCYDNPLFIEKMIQLFIKSASEYSTNVTIALKENDLKKINQLAHWIKPSIDLLNIRSLITIIREIESATDYNNELIKKILFSIEELDFLIKQMNSDLE